MDSNLSGRGRGREPQPSKSSIFVRLQGDGDRVTGAFVGDPWLRDIVWTGERFEPFDPAKPAHRGQRPSPRVSVNFFVPTDGAMKVIEGSAQWFDAVRRVRETHDLSAWMFTIERHGAAGDKQTFYSIVPAEEITPEVRARIDKSRRHDLRIISGGARPTPRTSTPTESAGSATDIDPWQ